MADQNLKSANEGDLIKHCLLAEVVTECSRSWEQVNFSETHAGAGVYNATAQEPPKDFIEQLKVKVSSEYPLPEHLGWNYWNLLRNWWDDPANANQYGENAHQASQGRQLVVGDASGLSRFSV
ncbi:MAG: hypothetical protein ABGZ23_09630 [Fuerstiella sp.]